MATIARLLVDVTGDNTGLRQTFVDSASRSQDFVRTLQDTMRRATFQLIDPRRVVELEAQLSAAQQHISRFVQGANNTLRSLDTGRFVSPNVANEMLANVERLKAQVAAEQQALARPSAGAADAGLVAADQFIASMRAELEAGAVQMKEAIFRGLLSPADARERAIVAADAYNQTLLSTLASLRASGNLTPQIQQRLIDSLHQAGLEAGALVDAGIAAGIRNNQALITGAGQAAMSGLTRITAAQTGALSNLWTRLGGVIEGFGHRGQHALIGMVFALQQFQSSTESGVQRSVHAFQTLALFFGPEGFVVAAVLGGLEALWKHFHKTAEEAEKAAGRMATAFADAANKINFTALQQQAQEILRGQPVETRDLGQGKVETILHKESIFAPGMIEGGLADLNAIKAALERNIASYGDRVTHETVRMGEQLKEVSAKAAPLQAAFDRILGFMRNPPPPLKIIEDRKPIVTTEKFGNAAVTQEIALLVSNLEHAREKFDIIDGSAHKFGGELLAVATAIDKYGGSARRAGESTDQFMQRLGHLDTLRKAFAAAADIKINVNFVMPDPFDVTKQVQEEIDRSRARVMLKLETPERSGIFKEFHDLAELADQIQNKIALNNAIRESQGQKPLNADAMLAGVRQRLADLAVQIRDQMIAAGVPIGIIDLVLADIIAKLNRLPAVTSQWAKDLNKVVDGLHAASNLIRAIGGVGADKFAQIVDEIAQTASSVQSAVEQGGTNVGADIQALADVIGTLKTIFSASGEIRNENNQVIRENSQRLAEVSLRLAGFAPNASNTVAAGGAAAALLADRAAREAFTAGATHSGGFLGTQIKGDLQTQIDALKPFLASVGLTFEQFKKIVADAGFEIFDKFGRIIPEAMQQFSQHIQDTIKALFTFQNTLQDQQTLASLRAKLSGVEQTPTGEIQQNLDVLQKLAPNLLPGQFDLTSAGGQEALRAALAALVERISVQGVDPADFGGFQNLGELTQIIDILATALLGLKKTTDAVTDSLSNVPVGFKVALYRFDAAAAQTWSGGLDFTHRLPKRTGPIDGNLPQFGGGTVVFNVQDGAIRVVGAPTDAPEEFGRRALKGMQALAQSKMGNSARWPEMN